MNKVDDSASLSKFGGSGRALGENVRTRSARSESMTTNTTYLGASPRLATAASPGTASTAFDSAARAQPVASRSSRAALPASAERSTADPVPVSLPSAVAPSSAVASTLTVQLPSDRSPVSFALSGTTAYQLIWPSL